MPKTDYNIIKALQVIYTINLLANLAIPVSIYYNFKFLLDTF